MNKNGYNRPIWYKWQNNGFTDYWRYSVKSTPFYLSHLYFHIQKQRKEPFLSSHSHCDLSTKRVCLGTNMADSNRRQDRGHVGENQELFHYFYPKNGS